MSKQPKWLERAKQTYKYHREQILLDSSWTITHTAKALRRSFGSVCEDIKIAQWLKTHESQLEKFEFAYEALRWIRKKQKEMDLTEIE